MIFTEEKIKSFKASNGMIVTLRSCKLVTSEVGYWIADIWESEIKLKGITYQKLPDSLREVKETP